MSSEPEASTETASLPDWGAGTPRHGVGDVVAIEGGIAVVGGVVGWLLGGPAIGAGVAAAMLVSARLRLLSRGRAVLRGEGATPLRGEGASRLINLTQGLAERMGVPAPKLYVIPRQEPNALVVWASGGHVAVTSSLLEDYPRTEAEAALAHCLVRLATGEARRTTYLLGLGFRRPEPVGRSLDVMAVAVTRYPPGLVAALEKARPVASRNAALWLVADGPTHEPAPARIAELNDL